MPIASYSYLSVSSTHICWFAEQFDLIQVSHSSHLFRILAWNGLGEIFFQQLHILRRRCVGLMPVTFRVFSTCQEPCWAMLHKSYKCAPSSGMASTHLRDATDKGITFGLPNRDIHLAPRPHKKSLKHSAVLLIYEHMEVAESFPQHLPKSLCDSNITATQRIRHISPHFATMLWHAFSSSRRRSSSSCASNCPLWSDLISWAWCIGIGHGVDTGGDRWVVVPCHSLVIVMIVTYWYILLSYCHIVRYLNGKGWIWLEYDYHDRTGYIMWHTRWRWHNTSNYPGANLPNTLTASASIRASSSLSWSRHRFASSNLSRFKPAVMWQLSVPQTYIHCRSAHFARDGFNISSYHLI